MSTQLVCDFCKKRVVSERDYKRVVIERDTVSPLELDFCDWACVAEWAILQREAARPLE